MAKRSQRKQRQAEQERLAKASQQSRVGDSIHTTAVQVSKFSGPMPPPELLQAYESVVPGAAERLLVAFEKQTDHRIAMEDKVISGDSDRAWAGLVCGLTVSLAVLAVSAFAIYKGAVVEGSLLAGTSLASLVGVFVYGTRARSQERQASGK